MEIWEWKRRKKEKNIENIYTDKRTAQQTDIDDEKKTSKGSTEEGKRKKVGEIRVQKRETCIKNIAEYFE